MSHTTVSRLAKLTLLFALTLIIPMVISGCDMFGLGEAGKKIDDAAAKVDDAAGKLSNTQHSITIGTTMEQKVDRLEKENEDLKKQVAQAPPLPPPPPTGIDRLPGTYTCSLNGRHASINIARQGRSVILANENGGFANASYLDDGHLQSEWGMAFIVEQSGKLEIHFPQNVVWTKNN